MTTLEARFHIGQLIRHRLFDYRGVVVDVDPVFQGSDEWYQRVAKSRPPKDQPWYRVLVHGAEHQTYVAERNLSSDTCAEPVQHPSVDQFFSGIADGSYQPIMRRN